MTIETIEKKITLFLKNEEIYFEWGVKKPWNGKEEMPEKIETYDHEVRIVFKSGRELYFSGIPFIYERFTDPADIPF